MLAFVVTTVASLEALSPRESDVLDGISRAFFAALDRDGSDFVIGVWGALALAAAYVIAGWVRRDAQSVQRERRDLEARRERIASEAPPRLERREWARIGANVSMKIVRAGDTPRAPALALSTHDVGAGGLAFFSDEALRLGTRLSLTLDLGERRPLAVRAVVVRVSPPSRAGAASLVAVKFSEIDSATRERLVGWVVAEQRREIAHARRGRLCACCARPLADGAEDMHPTCAARADVKQAA
jgi:hypothetical protein